MDFKTVFLIALTLVVLSFRVQAAELKRVTFGYSSIGPMATGVWMAKEVGAFEKYGIRADLIYISSGPVVVQALIGGDLRGGSGASNAVINAILGGAPIVAVGGTANRPYHRLWVQPEINRLEDLRGKTLGPAIVGEAQAVALRQAAPLKYNAVKIDMAKGLHASGLERLAA